jgi:hypothetical protein
MHSTNICDVMLVHKYFINENIIKTHIHNCGVLSLNLELKKPKHILYSLDFLLYRFVYLLYYYEL